VRSRALTGAAAAVVGTMMALTGGHAVAQSTIDQAEKKPAREMITRLHHDPLQLRVRVLGGYARAPTFLQKKTCGTCTWHRVDRKDTDRGGRVRYRLAAPRTGNWFYRVGTPERPNFRESYSRVARTFRS
jgi:hypothetical protein